MINTTEVRMGSNQMVFAPGILQWAIQGWKTSRGKEKTKFISIISGGYGIPTDVVIDLFRGHIDWNIDGQDVVFHVEAGRMAPRN